MCLLEDVINVMKILYHIEKEKDIMSLYDHGQDIELDFSMCGLGPLAQIIIFIILFFESGSLSTTIIIEQCVSSLMYIYL